MDAKRVDFFTLGQMTFELPDEETFLGLKFAKEAAKTGGSMPTVFNAANERAVALFLARKISFLQIYDIIEASMANHKALPDPSLDEILTAEAETYEFIERFLQCQ